MVSAHSSEQDYVDAGPKGYNAIPYDPISKAQISAPGAPDNRMNVQLGRWAKVPEEDTVDGLKAMISENSHEGDYISAGPKGYNAIPYDPIKP